MLDEKPYTEKSLMKLAADGDAAAFTKLFYLYKDRLYSFSLRLTSSPELAQDMVQDIFLKIWRDKGHLDKLENFGSFIFKMAQNQAINALKRMANQTIILAKIQQHGEACDRATEENIEFNEVNHLLNEVVEKLPAQQHLVFKLSREQGLKNDEIAHLLKISPNTVKNHLVIALRTVREFLRSNLNIESLPLLIIVLGQLKDMF